MFNMFIFNLVLVLNTSKQVSDSCDADDSIDETKVRWNDS